MGVKTSFYRSILLCHIESHMLTLLFKYSICTANSTTVGTSPFSLNFMASLTSKDKSIPSKFELA